MPRLPVLTGKEIIKALERAGFEPRNQTGSHIHLIGRDQSGNKRLVTVPDHGNREIPIVTFPSILRQAGLSREQFLRML